MTVDNMNHNRIFAKFWHGGPLYNENAIVVSGSNQEEIERIIEKHGLMLGGHGGPIDSASDNYEKFKVAANEIRRKFNVFIDYDTNLEVGRP